MENPKTQNKPVDGPLTSETRNYTSRPYKPILDKGKCLLGAIIALSLAVACGTPKEIPVETKIEYRDSVRIETVLDTIEVYRTRLERVRDYTGLTDMLVMETEGAKATAWVDTTENVLKGTLEDKQVPVQAVVPHQLEYHQRDSVITKEIIKTVEIEKEKKVYPRWLVLLSTLGILLTCVEGFRIYGKLKKKLPLG